MKKEEKQTFKPYQELSPILDILHENYYNHQYCIVRTKEYFYILFKIYAQPLVQLLNEEMQQLLEEMEQGLKIQTFPIKMCFDATYFNIDEQKKFLQEKYDSAKQEQYQQFLHNELELLQQLELTLVEEYRVKIFGQTVEEVLKHAYIFEASFPFAALPQNEKQIRDFLRFEHNPLERRLKNAD